MLAARCASAPGARRELASATSRRSRLATGPGSVVHTPGAVGKSSQLPGGQPCGRADPYRLRRVRQAARARGRAGGSQPRLPPRTGACAWSTQGQHWRSTPDRAIKEPAGFGSRARLRLNRSCKRRPTNRCQRREEVEPAGQSSIPSQSLKEGSAMNSTDRVHATLDKDLPLKEDIRLLGRLLGDTLREQEGDET